jgi:hypothetical protein
MIIAKFGRLPLEYRVCTLFLYLNKLIIFYIIKNQLGSNST